MRQERFYKIVIIALLLLNVGTLAFLFISRGDNHAHVEHVKKPPHRNPVDNIIINRLYLDEKQQEKFEIYKRQHRKSTDSVQRIITGIQKELFALVKYERMNVEKRDSLLTKIEESESAKHLITIDHFHDLRSMMRPEQVESFNEFMEDIGSRITGPGHKPHHRPLPKH